MKYFIVYHHSCDPESCSVFYSTLVIAESETDAVVKYCLQFDTSIEDFIGDEWSGYGTIEMKPVV
jgi:hypothetical protein